jgi:hypothetical protein
MYVLGLLQTTVTHLDDGSLFCLLQRDRDGSARGRRQVGNGEHRDEDLADAIRLHLGFNQVLPTHKGESTVSTDHILIQDVLTKLNQITACAVQDERVGLKA